jgi:polyribonucleotide nucleotidyltransferase
MKVEARVETLVNGKPMVFESGKIARQANGSVVVRYADTVVLAAVVEGSERRGADEEDFLPLQVEYREKVSAAGKFPGGFIKREGRPTTKEILTMRLIDRPIRPLFPKEYCNEIQVTVFVLSADRDNDPDILAMNATSAALCISGMPFGGPVGSVRIGKIGTQFVINPTKAEMEESVMDMVVSGTMDAIAMAEGFAKEVPEADILEGMRIAHQQIKEVIKVQLELQKKCGKPVRPVAKTEVNPELMTAVRSKYLDELKAKLLTQGKHERAHAVGDLKKRVIEQMCGPEPEKDPKKLSAVREVFNKVEKEATRQLIFSGKRVDGRGMTDIRQITSEVGILPRTSPAERLRPWWSLRSAPPRTSR